MTRKRAKSTRKSKPEPTPPLGFSMDELQCDPAEPPHAVIQAIDRAIDQILAGASTVHVKGQTEHQCQVQLVPLFIEKAEAAGLQVPKTAAGRLRVGTTEVFVEPLYLARPGNGSKLS